MIPKRTLNKEFEYIKKVIFKDKKWNDTLCKIALYSYVVKGFKSMHQGKHVEECFIELLGATPLDNDGKETFTYYGNCDFYLHNLPISLKSSIKKDGIWNKNQNYSQNFCKVFDTSRRPSTQNYKEVLEYLLKRVGWEIPMLCYTFDIELNKGVLFFSSLSEITKDKFEFEKVEDTDEFKNSMMQLFKFNGGSHYNISLKDVYETAKKYGRVIEFEMSEKKSNKYINNKIKSIVSIIEEIK